MNKFSENIFLYFHGTLRTEFLAAETFDAFASNNRLILNSIGNEQVGAGFWIGSALMAITFVGFAVFIYMMIFRLKKKTAEFCAMETVSEKQ